MRPFQIVILGIFAAIAVVSVIFLAAFEGGTGANSNPYGESVEIWGTLEREAFRDTISEIELEDKNFSVVTYREFDESSFDDEFVNAIAEGRSPDLVVLSSESLVKHRAKIQAISYETFSERTFKDRYVDGAELFAMQDGIYGIPFAVDPLVMYWNRDMFASSGIADAPATWESLTANAVPAMTSVNAALEIAQTALAFGEYANITHAKDILAMLIIQSGGTLVNETDSGYAITLPDASPDGSLRPATAALSFYTQFADPSSVYYSWNRAQRNDQLEFVAGRVGMYFGLGSEFETIDESNPNLNFDVAQVPQGASATIRRTYGTFYALAIPRAADNPQGAYNTAQVLATPEIANTITERLGLAPVSRSTLSAGTTNAVRDVLFRSALIARGWLDPAPVQSENVFKQMVEDVTSGRSRVSEAVDDATGRLELLF